MYIDIDKLFEGVDVKELRIYVSKDFKARLLRINHAISKEILDVCKDSEKKYKFSFIDETEKNDTVSFIMVNKINTKENSNDFDFENVYTQKGRVEMSIGRLITKLFGDKFPANRKKNDTSEEYTDIESFVNMYKATFEKIEEFELVKGEDITYYYNEDRYVSYAAGRLAGSCMRHDKCAKYFDIYVKNPDKVSLLILKDTNEPIENSVEQTGTQRYKIRGRAIIWKLDKIDHKSVENEYFMERIYTSKDSDVELYIEYAKQNGWLYKSVQSYGREYSIIDPKTNEKKYMLLSVETASNEYRYYPYMDTLSHFEDGWLDNEQTPESGIDLTCTDGSFDNFDEDYVTCDYTGDRIRRDDAVYCERQDVYCNSYDAIYLDYIDEYCTPDAEYFEFRGDYYFSSDGVYSDYEGCEIPDNKAIRCESEDDYCLESDAIYLDYKDEYCTPNASLVYDERKERDLLEEDAVHSEHYNTNILKDDAVEAIVNIDGDTSWVYEEDTQKANDGETVLDDIIDEYNESLKENEESEDEELKENNSFRKNIYSFNDFIKKYNK